MTQLVPPPLSLLDDAALFLDFDGTLVELAERPDAIRVPPTLGALLERLQTRLEGRLAVVSGRALADLDRHLPKGICASGSHGLELRLPDGSALPLSVPAGLDDVRAAARSFADAHPGLIIEDKPAGIAVHFRLAPQHEAPVRAHLEALAATYGFVLQEGKMVSELRPPGADKGDALRSLMREPRFAAASPVFMGDDLTDEHAFAAAADLGGAGILVGPPRATAARYRLASVPAVAAWLEGALS
jgi:trehalose 6-phosphate phosphatase